MKTEIFKDQTLRPALSGDMPACGRILNDWIDATPWMPRMHSHEEVINHHCQYVFSNRSVLVAENGDGEIEGFLAKSEDQFITGFYLSPEVRGKGLGSFMMQHTKNQSSGGLKLWTFVANKEAQRFYQREDFREIRRTDGDNEENLPDILYAWEPEGLAS